MNDGELRDAVRGTLTAVHSNTPVEQIVRRSRAIRARQRIPGLAVLLAAAVAAALAVTALIPSGRPAGRQPTVQAAAWTVVTHANGTVTVIIREFRNPAGLQHKLRADGVRASVIYYPGKLKPHTPFRKLFHVKSNPCRPFRGGQRKLLKVVPPRRPAPPLAGKTTITIHPSALPRHAGLQFIATSNIGHLQTYGTHMLGVWLVQATPHCTGT